MAKPVLLEICVESLDHALAAEFGGADRIEICQDLSCGGVTPSADLLRAIRKRVRIPIHGMIRPRPGDFCYAGHEVEIMKRDIAVAQDIGLDGIVLGLLDSLEQVDRECTRALVHAAHPLPVTFHRAFDRCPDLAIALEAVMQTGAKRILTSGGKDSVTESLASLTHLVQAANDRIVIMPGGGIRNSNIVRILATTGAREIHTSLGAADSKFNGKDQAAWVEAHVREFKRTLETRISNLE